MSAPSRREREIHYVSSQSTQSSQNQNNNNNSNNNTNNNSNNNTNSRKMPLMMPKATSLTRQEALEVVRKWCQDESQNTEQLELKEEQESQNEEQQQSSQKSCTTSTSLCSLVLNGYYEFHLDFISLTFQRGKGCSKSSEAIRNILLDANSSGQDNSKTESDVKKNITKACNALTQAYLKHSDALDEEVALDEEENIDEDEHTYGHEGDHNNNNNKNNNDCGNGDGGGRTSLERLAERERERELTKPKSLSPQEVLTKHLYPRADSISQMFAVSRETSICLLAAYSWDVEKVLSALSENEEAAFKTARCSKVPLVLQQQQQQQQQQQKEQKLNQEGEEEQEEEKKKEEVNDNDNNNNNANKSFLVYEEGSWTCNTCYDDEGQGYAVHLPASPESGGGGGEEENPIRCASCWSRCISMHLREGGARAWFLPCCGCTVSCRALAAPLFSVTDIVSSEISEKLQNRLVKSFVEGNTDRFCLCSNSAGDCNRVLYSGTNIVRSRIPARDPQSVLVCDPETCGVASCIRRFYFKEDEKSAQQKEEKGEKSSSSSSSSSSSATAASSSLRSSSVIPNVPLGGGGAKLRDCNLSNHLPASCEEMIKWESSSASERASAMYLQSQTRCCPQCHTATSKISGCNIVQCAKCRQPWCFNCGRTAEKCTHGTCNAPKQKDPNRDAAANELERYLFYWTRFENHKEAGEAVALMIEMAQDRMDSQVSHGGAKLHHVAFLETAAKVLGKCRRCLSHSYIYGFFLPENTKQEKANVDRFQYQQWMLENATEKLAFMINSHGGEEGIMELTSKAQQQLINLEGGH